MQSLLLLSTFLACLVCFFDLPDLTCASLAGARVSSRERLLQRLSYFRGGRGRNRGLTWDSFIGFPVRAVFGRRHRTFVFRDLIFFVRCSQGAPGCFYETVCTFGLPRLVRMAPVSDPLFAGHELSLQRGAHLLPHVGRFIAFWQK